MPRPKFPTLLPNQPVPPFFAETVNLLLSPESDVLELAVGQLSRSGSQRKNCTENDERSLKVIENTGCGKGISWNVIDKTGG
jgi:hypothetical protein